MFAKRHANLLPRDSFSSIKPAWIGISCKSKLRTVVIRVVNDWESCKESLHCVCITSIFLQVHPQTYSEYQHETPKCGTQIAEHGMVTPRWPNRELGSPSPVTDVLFHLGQIPSLLCSPISTSIKERWGLEVREPTNFPLLNIRKISLK